MARATVIGSGPNGLAAAVALGRAGYEVEVLEAAASFGGGVRTEPGPAPGFVSDVCSAVHPAVLTSPFFRAVGIQHRVEWITPEVSYAHPLDGGRAAIAWRDIDRTADGLGADARAWYALVRPLTRHLEGVVDFTGHALLRIPAEPLTAVRYGIRMLEQGTPFARSTLRTEAGAALVAGVVAHANAPMPSLSGAAAGLLLAAHGHARTGWSYPRGGAQRIADALASDLHAHGGGMRTGEHVRDLAALDWEIGRAHV